MAKNIYRTFSREEITAIASGETDVPVLTNEIMEAREEYPERILVFTADDGRHYLARYSAGPISEWAQPPFHNAPDTMELLAVEKAGPETVIGWRRVVVAD